MNAISLLLCAVTVNALSGAALAEVAVSALPDSAAQTEPVGPDRLNTPEMVELAQNPEAPLPVTDGVMPQRDRLIANLRRSQQDGDAYKPLTNVKAVLAAHGCSEIDGGESVHENGSRSATYVYECEAGLVFAREAWQVGTRNAGVAPGGKSFPVRPGVQGAGQYLIDEAGLRQSTVSSWEKGVMLNVTLQHRDGNRQAWLTEIVGQTVLVDNEVGIR